MGAETSREGFVPRHLRGKKVGPATCQWYHIAVSTYTYPAKPCFEPEDVTAGVHLCKTHIRKIGYVAGLYNRRQLEDFVKTRTRYLRNEVEHLKRIVDWQAKRLRGEITTPPKQVPTEGTIYAVLNGHTVKIGWTSNLERRMRQYPPASTLLVAFPGTRKDEAAIHRRFAHLTIHGREWFPYAPQVVEWVERMVAQHGQPEQIHLGPEPRKTPRPHEQKPMIKPKGYIPGTGRVQGGRPA